MFPGSCLQLRGVQRRSQSVDGARRKRPAGGSGSSQRQVRACSLPRNDFSAGSMDVRAFLFSRYTQKRRAMVFARVLPRACATNSGACAAVYGRSALRILDLRMVAVGLNPRSWRRWNLNPPLWTTPLKPIPWVCHSIRALDSEPQRGTAVGQTARGGGTCHCLLETSRRLSEGAQVCPCADLLQKLFCATCFFSFADRAPAQYEGGRGLETH